MTKFYKIKPIDNRNIEDVIYGRIWIPKASQLNDPYDCFVFPVLGKFIAEDELDQLIKSLVQKIPIFRDALGEWYSKAKNHYEKNVFAQEYLTQKIREIGVCSFLDSPFNIVTWSHYGNNHKGMCLEYELQIDEYIQAVNTDVNKRGYKYSSVSYTNVMPQYTWNDFLNSPELTMRLCLTTKYRDWSYENESRLLTYNHVGGEAVQLSHVGLKLTRIYLGCLAEKNSLNAQLQSTCKSLNIEVVQLKRKEDSFCLVTT